MSPRATSHSDGWSSRLGSARDRHSWGQVTGPGQSGWLPGGGSSRRKDGLSRGNLCGQRLGSKTQPGTWGPRMTRYPCRAQEFLRRSKRMPSKAICFSETGAALACKGAGRSVRENGWETVFPSVKRADETA